MKIFSAAQIKACDAFTVRAASITSLDLMEQAATACAEWIAEQYNKGTAFIVLCGMGNNGGDGLVIARKLHEYGYGVKAFVLKYAEEFSADCYANLQRLQQVNGELASLMQEGSFITDVQPGIVIIDAVLGTGLSRPVEGWLAAFVQHINELPNEIISVDMPAGLSADSIPDENTPVIKADHTLSFQFYKRSFLHPETGVFTGYVHLLDIGLNRAFIEATHTHYHTTDAATVKSLYRPRHPFSHKGTYGTACIIGGSHGMIGAMLLAVRAASRAGAGKVVSLVPGCGYEIMQSGAPEALCTVSGDHFITQIKLPEGGTGIGIGPGMGTNAITARAFINFVEGCTRPMVIDADALNIIARHPELLGKIPAGSILTPHPKEFERIFGTTANSMMQVEQARFQAMRYNIFIVLKGRYTAIVTPEGECLYNLTGNAGMAKGGSGDVLTGILTALLAQGYEPHEAAHMGVYLHGLAGDYAALKYPKETMTAGEVIDGLAEAFRSLSAQV